MELKTNRTIVLECYRKILRDHELSLVDEYIHDNYIQHSPTVKDGKAGLLEMLHFLKSLPQPAEHGPTPIIRTIAEGDLVAVHLDIKFMGRRMAVVDIFRLRDGKLAEHWDAGQLIAIDDSGPVNMTNGTATVDVTADAIANKKLISTFFEALQKREVSGAYLSTSYIEHNPDNGLLSKNTQKLVVHRIISEFDFVVAQCEYKAEKQLAVTHIFRLATGQIIEHWSVKQEVPDIMAHGNGMF